MSKTMIHATYQLVKIAIPNEPQQPNAVDVVNTFQAPPGFRLHSVCHLKEQVLIGHPVPVLMIFESLMQVAVDDDATPLGEMAGNA